MIEYVWSEEDIAVLRQMAREFKTRNQSSAGRDKSLPPPGQAPEVYIARSPSGGIPAMVEEPNQGTGTTPIEFPGSATCNIYRLLRTGTADPSLNQIPIVELVYNLGSVDVPEDTWVKVTRDKFGSWLVDTASLGGQKYIKVIGVIDGQHLDPPDGCVEVYDQCPSIFHVAILYTFYAYCDLWVEHECVLAVDVEGRRFEPGRKYPAWPSTLPPPAITGVVLPIGAESCDDVSERPVYVGDIGDPTRSVFVDELIGTICDTDGTGTASSTGTGTDTGDASEDNLILYRGTARRWDSSTCTWEEIEAEIYIAEMHGCELEIGERYEGAYERMVHGSETGTGSTLRQTCIPLYLVDHRKTPLEGICSLVRSGDNLLVYTWQNADECGNVECVYSYSINLCCTDTTTGTGGTTVGTGSDIFGECGCSEMPNKWSVSVAGVTTLSCFSGDCSWFNGTHILTHISSGVWSEPAAVSCDSIGIVAVTLTCGDPYTLNFGDAIYQLAQASWACMGSNVMNKVGLSSACSNWPATVTVVPV